MTEKIRPTSHDWTASNEISCNSTMLNVKPAINTREYKRKNGRDVFLIITQ